MVFVSATPCYKLTILMIIINGNTTVGSKKTYFNLVQRRYPGKAVWSSF